MNTHHHDETTKVIHGDCIETMNQMEPASVDAIVTDPPYGLGFMGKKWDGLPPSREWAEACYRVLKPGGHIAAFGGTRTWHRLAVAIEDAGFEMRDSLAWLYGSGFPKSMNVGKAIDATLLTGKSGSRSIREAADSREVIGTKMGLPGKSAGQKPVTYFNESMLAGRGEDLANRAERLGGSLAEGGHRRDLDITAPATTEAEQWDGWGTALKPAFEPIVLARKPLAEKTVARNVLTHGTGAINIDGCRIEGEVPSVPQPVYGVKSDGVTQFGAGVGRNGQMSSAPSGRWPANVLLDQHAAAWVDEQSGVLKSGGGDKAPRESSWFTSNSDAVSDYRAPDSGGASRFFYSAKAPKRERPNVDGVQHPTVKPLAIMQWLIRLVTPPNGTVLDPFAGSGTTLEAAQKLGFKSIGVEAEGAYLPLIDQRLQRSNTSPLEREGAGE